MQTEITYNQAIQISKADRQKERINQAEKLQEFLDSKCDMFSFADWEYYASETGKSLDWLKANASYNDDRGAFGTMLENAIEFGDTEMAELFM